MLTIQRYPQSCTVNFKSGTGEIKRLRQEMAQLAKDVEIPEGELRGDYINFIFSQLRTAGIFRKNQRIKLIEKLEALFNQQESRIETMKKEKEEIADQLEQLKIGISSNRPNKVTCDGYGDIYLTNRGLAQYNKILSDLTAAEANLKKCNDIISDANNNINLCQSYYPLSAMEKMKPYEAIISKTRNEIGVLQGKISLYKSQIQILKDNGELPN